MALNPARLRRRGPPGLSLWDPASLMEDDIRELYRFRLRFVDLKPTTDRDRDFANFRDFVRRADLAWLLFEGDALVATCFHQHTRVGVDGSIPVTFSEYGYAAVRGDPRMVLAQAWGYARLLLPTPWRPTFFGGFAYPHGYLPYATSMRYVWLLGDPRMPARERALAEELAARYGGDAWDPARRRYRFATLPREPIPRPDAPHRAPHVAAYERLNPDWREGQGLFLLGRIDGATLGAAASATLRRAAGRLRRAAP